MSDNSFLTQIQDTEKKAAKMISDAQLKSQKDIQKHEAVLAKAEAEKEQELKDALNLKIAAAQAEAKVKYETLLSNGIKEATTMEASAKKKIDSLVPMAREFFLSHISN